MEAAIKNSIFDSFYQNKTVLVTGHTGFKGSWLTLWLLQLGAKVAGFSAYYPSEPCNCQVLGLEKSIAHFEGDIRNFEQVRDVFNTVKPQVVFHLAAQPIVRRSYEEPKVTFDTNLGGTVNILECIRQTDSVKAAVLITSDKCYDNVEWIWGYRENDRLGGEDPYSASKGCAEIAINSYCQSYFTKEKRVNVASTRAGNVIGGGDWAENRIVPDCIKAWSENQALTIRNPQSTRPWQHVLEPLSGYLWLGALLGKDALQTGEAFNFGPKADVIQPVIILVKTFEKYWDKAKWQIKSDDSRKKESNLLKLCCDKAISMLNWKAILTFEETIEFTALWYKKYYEEKTNMLEFSKEQIQEYCALAKDRGLKWATNK